MIIWCSCGRKRGFRTLEVQFGFNGIPDFHSASGQSGQSDDFGGYASESDGKLPESGVIRLIQSGDGGDRDW